MCCLRSDSLKGEPKMGILVQVIVRGGLWGEGEGRKQDEQRRKLSKHVVAAGH